MILYSGEQERYGTAATTPEPAMTATALPAPRHLGIYESAYTASPAADGWTVFQVFGAEGETAPWYALMAGPVFGGGLGMQIAWPQALVGAGIGFFLALCIVIGRAGSLSTFRSRRAPAGTIAASHQGVRLRNGKVIARNRIRRLVCRNVQDSHVMVMTGGSGMAGALATAGAARHLADGNNYVPISYQIDIEADGRRIPVVGCMTEATAYALFDDLSQILDIH